MNALGAMPATLRAIGTSLVAAAAACSLASCSAGRSGAAVVWTDEPELAIAVELFNARGDQAVRLAYKDELSAALLSAEGSGRSAPAMAVGRCLDGAELRDRLASVDPVLRKLPERDGIYPELLAGGLVDGRRVLLPLSFNMPAIIFTKDAAIAGDGFTLSLEDLAAPAAAFRKAGEGARMGFSPRWDPRFFMAALDAGGARFRASSRKAGLEGRPGLAWDAEGLGSALAELDAWTSRVNGSAALEDDFRFRHLFSTAPRWLKDGRALFAYMDSSDMFLAGEESRGDIDFRWFSSKGKIPFSDGALHAGLVKGAGGSRTAAAFLRWLLTPEAQRAVLERSRAAGVSRYSFGFLGGFSSIRSVNDGLLPGFYPALVGHAPPADRLIPPAQKPSSWPKLRDSAIAPWALEASAGPAKRTALGSDDDLSRRLEERIESHARAE
jgi:ABC-type glycerol-3-phosphate transport system substrate-binding protein